MLNVMHDNVLTMECVSGPDSKPADINTWFGWRVSLTRLALIILLFQSCQASRGQNQGHPTSKKKKERRRGMIGRPFSKNPRNRGKSHHYHHPLWVHATSSARAAWSSVLRNARTNQRLSVAIDIETTPLDGSAYNCAVSIFIPRASARTLTISVKSITANRLVWGWLRVREVIKGPHWYRLTAYVPAEEEGVIDKRASLLLCTR